MKLRRLVPDKKKGNINFIAMFFIILMVVLFLGFIMGVGSAVIRYVFDIATPQLSNLGQVGDTNLTQVASYTIAPLNTLVQTSTWLTGVLYIMALIGCFGFAMASRITPSRWLIGFFFICMLILIGTSIFISNMYQDVYSGTNDLASRLQDQVLLSNLVLYSPLYMSIIGFITGIIIFSGLNRVESF